ncbi:MAG: FAD-dependent oxidoreductase [Bacillota bacterium]
MRIIVIGAVAAGTSAAAKARRNSEAADIIIYEMDTFISYSGCGMPYYIGGALKGAEQLTPRDPAFFKNKYNVDILTAHEALHINPSEKAVSVKNMRTGELFEDKYDKLILATGAKSKVPPIKGSDLEHVFTLRSIGDMYRIKKFIDEKRPGTAAIIGSGFIGLELCENFRKLGIGVTLIELLDQVAPNLDQDIAAYVADHLKSNDVTVLTGASTQEIRENGIHLSDGTVINSDLVIIAAGVRPNTELAKQAGIEIGELGGIKVNRYMETSIPDIYACGDCIEQYHIVTGKPVYRPLGSTANKTGRIAGENVTGGTLAFRGVLGTGIFRVFNMTVAQTGLTEREAVREGYSVIASYNIKPNKPEYFGGKDIVIKSVADKTDGRLLGVQIVGEEGVDKRIDVFAMAITFGAKAEDLFHLDLAYAPPYSTTKDPVMYSGMILDNAIHKGRRLISVKELDALKQSGRKFNLIDTRVAKQYQHKHIEGAINIPHERLRSEMANLEKDIPTVTYCNKGVTGNATQNILINNGFQDVYTISGGYRTYEMSRATTER